MLTAGHDWLSAEVEPPTQYFCVRETPLSKATYDKMFAMSEPKKVPFVGARLSLSLEQADSASAWVRALTSMELLCSAVVCPAFVCVKVAEPKQDVRLTIQIILEEHPEIGAKACGGRECTARNGGTDT